MCAYLFANVQESLQFEFDARFCPPPSNNNNDNNNNNNNIYRDLKARAHTRTRTNKRATSSRERLQKRRDGERGGGRKGTMYEYASQENMCVSKRWTMERGRKGVVGQREEGQGGRGNTMNKWL